ESNGRGDDWGDVRTPGRRLSWVQRGLAKDSAALFPPPALTEYGHCSLARLFVAVDRRAIFVLTIGQRPQPLRAHGRGGSFHDAADNHAVLHVIVVVAPLGY